MVRKKGSKYFSKKSDAKENVDTKKESKPINQDNSEANDHALNKLDKDDLPKKESRSATFLKWAAIVIAFLGLIIAFLNWLNAKNSKSTDLYQEKCSIPIFFEKANDKLRVVIGRYDKEATIEVGNLLKDRFFNLVKPHEFDIELKYCKELTTALKPDRLYEILKENNADLLVYGNYVSAAESGKSLSLSYNFALLKDKFDFLENQSNTVGRFITIENANEIIDGKGQEEYDYILYYYLGQKFMWGSQVDTAITYFDKALKKKATPDVFSVLSYCKVKAGKPLRIVKDFIDSAAQIFPSSSKVYLSKANIELFQGDMRSGIKSMRYCLDNTDYKSQIPSKQIPAVYHDLALAYYRIFDEERNKVGGYDNLERMNPQMIALSDSAINYSRMAVQGNPDYLEFYLLAGKVLLASKRPEAFVALYKSGLNKDAIADNLREGLGIYYRLAMSKDDKSYQKTYEDSASYYDKNAWQKFNDPRIRSRYVPNLWP